MGSKETKTTTELPPPSPEEKEATARFNAILDAQMEKDYDKHETKSFVFKRQGEIDQLNKQIAELNANMGGSGYSGPLAGGTKYRPGGGGGGQQNAQLMQQKMTLQNQLNDLMAEGGEEKVKVRYVESEKSKERRLRNQAESDAIQRDFFASAKKLLRGDFSVTAAQKQQIQQIVGEHFDPVMDLLNVEFNRSEEAVTTAVQRLIDSGKADIATQYIVQKNELQSQLREQKFQVQKTAASLGRSYSDTDFQRATAEAGQQAQARLGEYQIGALEQLGAAGTANMAQAIAQLRGQRANSLGTVAGNKATAGMGLSMLAANPLMAFGAGGQFLQLNNALAQQGTQNLLATGGLLSNAIGQMTQARMAQPTTTQSKPWGVLDILGSLAGVGGAVAGGL